MYIGACESFPSWVLCLSATSRTPLERWQAGALACRPLLSCSGVLAKTSRCPATTEPSRIARIRRRGGGSALLLAVLWFALSSFRCDVENGHKLLAVLGSCSLPALHSLGMRPHRLCNPTTTTTTTTTTSTTTATTTTATTTATTTTTTTTAKPIKQQLLRAPVAGRCRRCTGINRHENALPTSCDVASRHTLLAYLPCAPLRRSGPAKYSIRHTVLLTHSSKPAHGEKGTT
eukprot:359648-Chlamydomonas_euryale.AAC.4